MKAGVTRYPDELGLAAPARRALAAAGISSLRQLSLMSEKELTALHGIGPIAMKRIQAALQEASKTK